MKHETKHDRPEAKPDKVDNLPPAKHAEAPPDKHTPHDDPRILSHRILSDMKPAHVVEPDPVPARPHWLEGAQSSPGPVHPSDKVAHPPARPSDGQQYKKAQHEDRDFGVNPTWPSPDPEPTLPVHRTQNSPAPHLDKKAPRPDPTPAPIPRPAVKPR